MKFVFCGKTFNLENCNDKYFDYFNNRLVSCNDKVTINNHILFTENGLTMNINNEKTSIDKKIENTDLYQIYNNYLSYLINSNNRLYIHSAVISKNNKGILLLGNFGQGKTTLSCLSQEYGYEINSTDHSVIEIINNKLYLKEGSSFVKEKDFKYNIAYQNTVKNIEIINIVLLYGLSDNGVLHVSNLEKKYITKRLYQFSAWHIDTPLKTDFNIKLFDSKNKIVKFLNKLENLNIDINIIRGNNLDIIGYFDRYLKEHDNSDTFINGLKNQNVNLMKKSDLSDLHVHGALGGSNKNYKLPIFNKLSGYNGFKDYIKNIDCSTLEKYNKLIIDTIETEIKDGIKLLEMSIDIRYFDFFNDIDLFIINLWNIKNKYKEYIDIRYDIGISKSTDIGKFDLILDLIETRFFSGIDLYGNEEMNDFERFKDIYTKAKKYHLKRKVHVGEFTNFKNIEKSLVLEPNVIQHGITINPKKIDISRYKHITFNIAVSSNIMLGYILDIKHHPIRMMYDSGLKVTINTDDKLVFGKSVIDEYNELYLNNIFNLEELNEIRKNGIY